MLLFVQANADLAPKLAGVQCSLPGATIDVALVARLHYDRSLPDLSPRVLIHAGVVAPVQHRCPVARPTDQIDTRCPVGAERDRLVTLCETTCHVVERQIVLV